MSKRKLKILRVFAAFMLIGIVNQIFFPTVSLALTSGNTQPEVWGYQPVDATDNVSLTSGKFNYTIPITSIPEFPMAIGYNSGLGMDQDASVFGFGFNGFSGAIARSINGLPDDLNGAKSGAIKHYSFGNEPMWDAQLGMTINLGLSLSDYFSVGANATTVYGYNSYNGFYGAIGTGVGLGLKLSYAGIGNPSIGVGIYNDSRAPKPRLGAQAGLSFYGAKLNYSVTDGEKWQWSASAMKGLVQYKNEKLGIIGIDVTGTDFPTNNRKVSSSLASMAYVIPRNGGSSLGMAYAFGVYAINTEWSIYKLAENKESYKSGMGFMYLNNYDRSKANQIGDMTIEGEDSFNEASYNNPSYLQKDNYNINTMGLSGAMEIYQKSYGVVSRNYTTAQKNKRNTYSTRSLIDEVHPWTGINQTKLNKSADVIAILKQAFNSDFEVDDVTNILASQLVSEKERVNFNGPNQRFDPDPVFKMRGDNAGEYDLSSSSYSDHGVNPYSLIHVSGTSSDPEFNWLGVEKNVPLYYPNNNVDYNAYAASHTIERSTHIKKHTIGSILAAYSTYKGVDAAGAVLDDTDPLDPFNFNQSFYSHYEYTFPSIAKGTNVVLNDHLNKFNLLDHLSDMRDQTIPPPSGMPPLPDPAVTSSYFNDLIGGIEVESVNGLRYYFNLPAFNKTTKNTQLMGKGVSAPVIIDNGYHSYVKDDGDYLERNKLTEEETYMYPYAWMLTAVVGDDYIDFDNIPGPSDGDIGYWVKFKYAKTCENYRWRYPFTGMSYYPGVLHKLDDDMYSTSTGTKEIYVLSEIESSNYTCKYNYQKRFDGLDAAAEVNGTAINSLRGNEPSYVPDMTGGNFQFVVTQIDLYKKHTDGNNSSKIVYADKKIIKSTKFSYDYTTCSGVPNNYLKYVSSVAASNLPYHIKYDTPDDGDPIEKGKLTLRKVQHIAYDETGLIANATYLPSYNFNYNGDVNAVDNPDYDPKCVDQWGNYMKNAKNVEDGVNYYHAYPEYIKSEADNNAKVFKLQSIDLPSGGRMEVEYEAQTYGFVEDRVPFAMRHVYSIDHTAGNTWAILKVDVTDIGGTGFSEPDALTTNANGDKTPVVKVGDELYGELAFYRSTETTDPESFKEYNIIVINENVAVTGLGSVSTIGGRLYQDVTVGSMVGEEPFVTQCKTFMYGESEEMRATKDNVNGSCISVQDFRDQYEAMSGDSRQDAIRKIVAHGNNLTASATGLKNKMNTCFGVPGEAIYPHWSFLRTPIYKAKYTGAVVKSIHLKDGFQYASMGAGTRTVGAKDNEYGTNYFYDLESDGTSTSSGVATTEPGGGKSNVIDVFEIQGSGFMSAPNVLYSKTAVENLYDEPITTPATGDKVPRKKGKTVYEFYTPKDAGLQFNDHFSQQNQGFTSPIKGNLFLFGIFTYFMIKIKILGKEFKIKIPKFVPLTINWKLDDQYHLKSYAYTDYTDIYGHLKTVHQKDAFGQELGSQTYSYYGIDEEVPVYKNGFTSGPTATSKKPGKVDQVWSEAYYTKRNDIHYAMLLLLFGKTEKDYCYTNMKYSYVPPVLKEITATMDGLTTKTSYTGFDYYTGNSVEGRVNDSYDNIKITRTVPAYWKYPEMGPRSVNDNYINNLTANTGTYMYLNTIDDAHLISAGVVKWTKGNIGAVTVKGNETWGMISYLKPQRNYIDATGFNYDYNSVSGNTIRSAYSVAARSGDATAVIQRVQRNAHLYKPFKGYTYEVPLNTDGTFKNFTAFDYSLISLNPKWKLLTTNEYYSQNGVLVQSKDVLSKYASQLLGYNFSNRVAAVSNSSWGGAAYEGAENTYSTSAGSMMLEDNKVKLLDAKPVKACEREFLNEMLTSSDFTPSGGYLTANVLNLTMPTLPNYNVPFAKIQVTYAHDPSISRNLYVSVNDNNDFQVMSNLGETFDGFFVYPQPSGSYKLLFRPADFSAFTLDNTFTPAGYTAYISMGASVLACELANKPYQLPKNNCGPVHTGSYAFALQPGNTKGTDFVISASGGTVVSTEFKRKYKALVWVHSSSPSNTELVMQITNSSGALLSPEVKTSKATPYAVAGEWSLLRLDFDLSSLTVSAPYVHVFVRNASTNAIATYDDYRVLPYHSDMINWVFEHHNNRVVSALDSDNFASYSAYDNRGRVVESAVELQNYGKRTTQKFMYNDQKTN